MAEKQAKERQDGCAGFDITAIPVEDNPVKKSLKRSPSTSPTSAPSSKSPRHDTALSPTATHTPEAGEQAETNQQAIRAENTAVSPTAARRRTWRRSSLARRCLPALPNPYQALSKSISTSLPLEERLEKLMEASMKLALERTQSSLPSVANISLESFKKQVETIQKEWGCLAKSLYSDACQLPSKAVSSSDPAIRKAMDKVQIAINRLQNESESWETLLNKHRSKAEELERMVQQGQESGITLNTKSLAQSSVYHFIQSKPDYQLLLHRQQPMLHTIETIMDTQCKMVRKLLSIKDHSQLLVKKTSSQLAAQAGFQDLSCDIRNLMGAPLPTTYSPDGSKA
ncbi:kinetochore-associated protein DSN1 homolog [Salarias fasciatus]|uniref:kinetochore-associated protein DSN1 homolog n=1 Tax=Salarias fasciatus TaxID=181472 RepID=UPI0011765F4E|nr:kinetochore-associated protein DSN1 homolog [Salarias fasciatus]